MFAGHGGGSIRRNGIYDQVAGLLRQAGKTVVDFAGIPPTLPLLTTRLAGPTGFGRRGGLDPGGWAAARDGLRQAPSLLAARYPGTWRTSGPGPASTSTPPLGVIVTVAGTGSECNGGAVITTRGRRSKTGRDYPQLNPPLRPS